MKRYAIQMLAGVPVELDHPGRIFTLQGCVTPVNVSLQAAALRTEILEQLTPGFWADFEEKPFTRIRIESPVDQLVTFIVSNMKCGWAVPMPSQLLQTTDLTGTAASATVSSQWVDLGDEWASCILYAQFYGTASAGQSLAIDSAADSVGNDSRLSVSALTHNQVAFTNASGTNVNLTGFRPANRFVRVRFLNGATIQGTARVVLIIMRNMTT
ncbi:MAG: hypothetical protein DI561_15085 [Thauera sp.]|nr:MAG: hypothetical protein DI561_15085 [Thauera sp.]